MARSCNGRRSICREWSHSQHPGGLKHGPERFGWPLDAMPLRERQPHNRAGPRTLAGEWGCLQGRPRGWAWFLGGATHRQRSSGRGLHRSWRPAQMEQGRGWFQRQTPRSRRMHSPVGILPPAAQARGKGWIHGATTPGVMAQFTTTSITRPPRRLTRCRASFMRLKGTRSTYEPLRT